MKFSLLLWSGLWRRPARTVFTFVSVVIAFILFGLLHGVSSGMDALIEQMDANRLRVQGEGSRRDLLPVGYAGQIARMPGVASVSAATFLGGYFRDPKNSIGAIAVDDAFQWERARELRLAPAQLADFRRVRTGAIIGRVLADRYGWHIGDRVPLISNWARLDGSNVWQFDVIGIYDVPSQPRLATEFWTHYEFLEEGRVSGKGTTNTFVVYTRSASENAAVAASIDRTFVNSSAPTATQSDREWQRAAWQQILDVNLLVRVMVGAAMFTLLLVTANTMMQSVTQRVPELAVLKAIGFTDPKVLGLVVAESLVICVLGAGLGLVVAKSLFPLFAGAVELDAISMPLEVPLTGLAIALLVGLVTATVPALRAKRLSVVDALAGRH
jgi:putative ABC transport system permease protein